ncbi:hypothetical protein AMIS_3850 [Actinoplanes missouriensis 431]|uniref:Secreted protein n=1 Tax=Actinoplanes missouriensis (strain ATCC 14538 / DSM 43046 / CBS 188.64 / JCM 3121 / NBRC 102363 / NCIMB 12654 / NRRL B-3342 / UNCC 431) TaxID=512565 RepID=I0GXW8_ACTM4|nr:hypothetical protein [Actinoplanes missouriensis]BAL85605.1 hypothetical protein AMIS_3850 [Actinoplanes missouriensis 431]
MAIAHIAVLSAALSALLMLPCAAVAVLDPQTRGVRRLLTRDGRRELRSLRRLDRALQVRDPVTPTGSPSIEQIAYDLRRLDKQRRSGPTRYSEVWSAAVLSAYDARLQLACRCLGLPEHLQPLTGVDREIERLRVEAELQAAGMLLRTRS